MPSYFTVKQGLRMMESEDIARTVLLELEPPQAEAVAYALKDPNSVAVMTTNAQTVLRLVGNALLAEVEKIRRGVE